MPPPNPSRPSRLHDFAVTKSRPSRSADADFLSSEPKASSGGLGERPPFYDWGLGRPQTPRGLSGSTTSLSRSPAPAGRLMPTCPTPDLSYSLTLGVSVRDFFVLYTVGDKLFNAVRLVVVKGVAFGFADPFLLLYLDMLPGFLE